MIDGVREHGNAMGLAGSEQRWLWTILAVALAVRLMAACAVQSRLNQQSPVPLCVIGGDAEGYWELARKIVHGEAYALYDPPRYVMRMPGFPLVLAAGQAAFGESPLAVRCWLAVLGTLSCWTVYGLGRTLVNGPTGLLAAAWIAVAPTQIGFSVMFLTEMTFGLTMTASLWAMAVLLQRVSEVTQSETSVADQRPTTITPQSLLDSSSRQQVPQLAVLSGVLLACAIHVRPTWIVTVPLALGWVLLAARGQRLGWTAAGYLAIGIGLLLGPWTYRNYRVTGHVIPTTLWMGPSLYDGLNPTATGDSNMEFFERDLLMSRMTEYEMDREYRRRAWAWAAAEPQRAVSLAWVKLWRYWNPFPNASQFQQPLLWWGTVLSTLPLYATLPWGAWSIRQQPQRWRTTILTVGPALLFCGVHLFFVGSVRYRLPAELPLAVLSASGLCHFCCGSRRGEPSQSALPSPTG